MIFEELNKYRIILASRSPRRQQLLSELGLKFRVVSREWEENYPVKLKGEEIALFVAEAKAASFSSEIGRNEIVITADTIVWCNGRVLDKPVDKAEATRIVGDIRHYPVITAVCLISAEKAVLFIHLQRLLLKSSQMKRLNSILMNFSLLIKPEPMGSRNGSALPPAAVSKVHTLT
jgi:septum formation protein